MVQFWGFKCTSNSLITNKFYTLRTTPSQLPSKCCSVHTSPHTHYCISSLYRGSVCLSPVPWWANNPLTIRLLIRQTSHTCHFTLTWPLCPQLALVPSPGIFNRHSIQTCSSYSVRVLAFHTRSTNPHLSCYFTHVLPIHTFSSIPYLVHQKKF